jgi:hypothetical protein
VIKNKQKKIIQEGNKCSCRNSATLLVLDADLIEFARDAAEPQIQSTRAALECSRCENELAQPNKRKAETSSNRVSHSLCQSEKSYFPWQKPVFKTHFL